MKLKYLSPFLIALFAIVTLIAQNVGEIRLEDTVRSAIIAIFLTFCSLLILRLFTNDWEKATLISVVIVLIIFSYGHIYRFLREYLPWGLAIVRHRFLIPLVIIIIAGSTIWLRKKSWKLQAILSRLAIFSGLLLIYPIMTILLSEGSNLLARNTGSNIEERECSLTGPEVGGSPDIYYIILDGYTREDVLLERYNFDNTSFISELLERDFYVASQSQSNYAWTGLSLTSSLNFDYLDFNEAVGHDEGNVPYSSAGIPNNEVRRELECIGYQTVSLDSGTYWSGWRGANFFLSPSGSGDAWFEVAFGAGLNPFESLLLNSSIGLILEDAVSILSDKARASLDHPFQKHRERILFALDETGSSVPYLPSPKFVFSHIISPHSPYVFGPQGEYIIGSGPFTLLDTNDSTEEESIVRYRDQVIFLNTQIIEMIDDIRANSKNPPLIIIQADHGLGVGMKDKMSILNAYHLPHGGNALLYETISPVNTFRIIFNYYFGTQYDLLDDKSFYSFHGTFDFVEYPNIAQE